MTPATKRGRGEAIESRRLCMLLKLSWNKFERMCDNFRMLNVIPMVTTRKIATKYKQKRMRQEFKHFTIKKSQLNAKESSNAGNKRQKSFKAKRKQIAK